MLLTRLVTVCVLATLLAACGTFPKGSVTGSESGALKAPDFVVRGKTVHDQQWIDETVEAGVAGLSWQRPTERPPEWDKPLSRSPRAAADAPIAGEAPTATPAKKKRWRDRLHFWPSRKKAVDDPGKPVDGG